MTIRTLPEIKAFQRPEGLESLPSVDALNRWDAGVRAADGAEEASISIYDMIGEDPWSGAGTTAKRIAAALRSIGAKDVTVNINSPGGDLFEGIAIYNLLRAHSHKVIVRVMGLAASAASIIAMAGDEIQIARAGFMMVHNCWVLAIGNRHDMREIADWLEPFDAAMSDVYVARTGLSPKDVVKLMDAETWIGGADAVEKGFADEYLPADQVTQDASARAKSQKHKAVATLEASLAKQGFSRSERRSLIAEVKSGMPSAVAPATHDAGELAAVAASLRKLQLTLKP